MGTVYVIGSTNVDTVLTVERHPEVGETVNATGVSVMPGGKGANQAAAAALAGARTVFVTHIGDDPNGARYREHLALRGVDTSSVVEVEGPTGQATIVVNAEGDNNIIVVPGANATLGVDAVATLEGTVGEGDVVSLQLEVPRDVVRAALTLARSTGATSIFNPSPWQNDVGDLVELADIIVVNEAEAEQLGLHDDRVIRTLGPDGASWGDVRANARPIDPVDTAGAGDAFTGTLAAGLANGGERSAVLQAAVDAATEACLFPGAQRWAQESDR